MIQLILGGARSGKSSLAESLASGFRLPVTYLATATAGDAEMQARINRHQRQRPAHWHLLEEPLALTEAISAHTKTDGVLLVDCLTLWLSNQLFKAPANLDSLRDALCEALERSDAELILVSNEVGLGVVPMGAVSRQFVDHAGWLNQAVARAADRVVLVSAGLPLVLKGAALNCP